MRAALALTVLLTLPGCKKKAARATHDAAAGSPPAAVAVPDLGLEPLRSAHDVTADGLRAILPPKPGLPAPFANVPLRTGPLPAVLEDGIGGDGWWQSDAFPGALVEPVIADDIVWAIKVGLPPDGRDVLAEEWGPPVIGHAFIGEGETDERPAWFDPEARLRAWIVDDPMTGPALVIQRYTPTLAALDQLKRLAKLLGKPIAARETVAGTHWNEAVEHAELPPYDWDGYDVTVSASGFSFRGDDTITAIATRVYYGSAAHEQELLAAIAAAWGAPESDGEQTIHGAGPFLEVSRNTDSSSLDLEVTAAR